MASTFVYSGCAPDSDAFEAECRLVDAAGFIVDFSRAWWERSAVSIPARQRPKMQRLLWRACAGDTVVVTDLASLGRNLPDVLATIEQFRSGEVRLYCLELGDANLANSAGTPLALRVLRAAAKFEQESRSARMRESAAAAIKQGRRLGRRPSVDASMYKGILAALESGTSVSALARNVGVSRQTIIRIRATKGATENLEK